MDHAFFRFNRDSLLYGTVKSAGRLVHLQQVTGTHLPDQLVVAVVYHDQLVALEQRDEDVDILIGIDAGEIFLDYAGYVDRRGGQT